MPRRGLTLLVATLLVVGLVGAGSALPVPYVALEPGPTVNTLGSFRDAPLITIGGHKTYPATGHLNLTTVSVRTSLELPAALAKWADDDIAVVPEEVIFPPGQTRQQIERRNERSMRQSQQHAIVAALSALDIPVRTRAGVGSTTPGTPAAETLHDGDVILAVEGQPVTSVDQLRSLISSRPPGEPVRLRIRRDGVEQELTVDTVPSPSGERAIVGFVPVEIADYPFDIDIRLEDVGGPSAGLIFALGIYDLLTPGSLTGGEFVAGTGEITDTGEVLPIGGIAQKLVAARQAGATLFLTPKANCAEALEAVPEGLRLIRVDTLAAALSALEVVRTGEGELPGCEAVVS